MRRKAVVLVLLALLLATGAVATVAIGAWRSLDRPLHVAAEGYLLDIAPGRSLRAVVHELHDAGAVEWTFPLVWYARLSGLAARVRAGEYLLEPGVTPRALLDQLVAGRVLLHALTFVEGWTFTQMLDALANQSTVAHTLAGVAPADIVARVAGEPLDPEGRFFPDTYRFPRGTADVAILAQAYARMSEQLAAAWAERDPELPMKTPDQALVLASLIEKETGVDEERARISGVFVNRLRLGMRLQSDPTVIYGLGAAFDGDLRTADLANDTPYNTYTRAGLPPTPIAMPGAASLRAAVHPATSDELYFVATGTGGHVFSSTLAEHRRAVARYLETLRGSTGQP
jgi:UPF0755 protein